MEGVEGEEPDDGGGGAADGLVRDTVGGVHGAQARRPCGEPEDDRLVGAARPGCRERVQFGARPGGAGGPHHLPAQLARGGPQGGRGRTGVGGLVEGERVEAVGRRRGERRGGEARGVQPAPAEVGEGVGVADAALGDGRFGAAGVGVPSGGEPAVGEDEECCA